MNYLVVIFQLKQKNLMIDQLIILLKINKTKIKNMSSVHHIQIELETPDHEINN
jgi:hypothetical protein